MPFLKQKTSALDAALSDGRQKMIYAMGAGTRL